MLRMMKILIDIKIILMLIPVTMTLILKIMIIMRIVRLK